MTLSAILIALEDALTPLMENAGGILAVADSEYDALESLTQAPDRWRVVMVPGGCDSGDGGDDVGGYVEDQIHFYVQSPRGMSIGPAKGLHRTKVSAAPSYLARKEWLIQRVRGFEIDDETLDREVGRTFRFLGWDWVKVEGVPWRAARVRFQVRYILTDPSGPDPLPPILLNAFGYIPPGGEPGQVLVKTGPDDFDLEWQDPPSALSLTIDDGYLIVSDGTDTKRIRLLDLP
ncbi:MAG: hypothetical protein OJI67_07865 [Prosthecobacter sp.]|nr:hypothetical protein [Prosthecobacter sp.]